MVLKIISFCLILVSLSANAQKKSVYFDSLSGKEVGWSVGNYARFNFRAGSDGYNLYRKRLSVGGMFPVEWEISGLFLRTWFAKLGDSTEIVVDCQCKGIGNCGEVAEFVASIPHLIQMQVWPYELLCDKDSGSFILWGWNPSSWNYERIGTVSIVGRSDWVIHIDVDYPVYSGEEGIKLELLHKGDNRVACTGIYRGYFYKSVK